MLLRPLGGEAFGQIRRVVRNGRHEAPRVVQLVEFGAPGVEVLAAPACDDDGRRVGQFVECHEQRGVRVRKFLQHAPGRAQRALGRVEVARLAEQQPEPDQDSRGNAVAGRRGVVAERLRPQDQLLVIVGGEVEAARVPVLEVLSIVSASSIAQCSHGPCHRACSSSSRPHARNAWSSR